MGLPDSVVEHIHSHLSRSVEELEAFCAIPSVSTLSEHADDVRRAAEWLADRLERLGIEQVSVLPTAGHPMVYGDWMHAPGRPTVLVYGHYDVQPVDPIAEWRSDPFAPTVRDDCLYARGVSDMKGQIVALFAALEALREAGPYPVNLKFMLEGEEEAGSTNLEAFVDVHGGRLGCDFILNCDGGILGPDAPSLTYALRGLSYFELEVFGPASDLHSGVFGGAVHNPAQVLCDLIAAMHDDQGRVSVPGFYDAVRPLDEAERRDLATLPFDDDAFKRAAGVTETWGETGYTDIERTTARPTLEVNGLVGGFTGEGAKTVLPARALAKLSMRTVPDQDGRALAELLRRFLAERAPSTVRWELRELSHGDGAIVDRETPWMKAAADALEEVFGRRPGFKREGGSIPIVGLLKRRLGADTVLLGFELPDAGFHGPNEKMHLPTFHRGIETYARFLSRL